MMRTMGLVGQKFRTSSHICNMSLGWSTISTKLYFVIIITLQTHIKNQKSITILNGNAFIYNCIK